MDSDTSALRSMVTDHVRCRTYGHSWDEHRPADATRDADLTLRCERCGMIRYDRIDVHGDVYGRSYEYTEDYRVGRLSRPDLRIELLRRLKRGRRA